MSKVKALLNPQWKINANRYVAFIDIMGFKDMMARSSHNVIYRMMKSIDKSKKFAENIDWTNAKRKFVTSTFYSDSIIIYSKDNSHNSASSINATVSAFSSDLFRASIPHKGAIAFGKMTLDNTNSIFFGQPLIDAYLLQEELSFYCIVVHSSAEHELAKKRLINKLVFFSYSCAFKGGTSNHLTIPPLGVGGDSERGKKLERNLFNGLKRLRYKTSGHLRKYIDNTDAYMKAYREHLNSL